MEDAVPYLVMELLQGENLESRLRNGARLPLAQCARLLAQLGKALRKAHEAGIVHRDLKPANLFLARIDDEDEILKILDFGIAKETLQPTGVETKTGEVMGSPHYMSPEQARADKGIDQRADLWAVGVILYRMTTGTLPFQGDVLGAILSRILVDPPPPVRTIAPDLPESLDAFFAKALAKAKESRFQSIRELTDHFLAIAGEGRARLASEVSLEPFVPAAPAIAVSPPNLPTQSAMPTMPLPATQPLPAASSASTPSVPGTLTHANIAQERATPSPLLPAPPARSILPRAAIGVVLLALLTGSVYVASSFGRSASNATSGTGPAVVAPPDDVAHPEPGIEPSATLSASPEPSAAVVVPAGASPSASPEPSAAVVVPAGASPSATAKAESSSAVGAAAVPSPRTATPSPSSSAAPAKTPATVPTSKPGPASTPTGWGF